VGIRTHAGVRRASPRLETSKTARPTSRLSVNPDAVTNVYHRAFHWGLLAKWIWYAGIAAVGLCLLLSNLSFGRKLRKNKKKIPSRHCKLPVYEVEALPSPCLFGVFRPAIYITPDVSRDKTSCAMYWRMS
jgi:hypothetical protein